MIAGLKMGVNAGYIAAASAAAGPAGAVAALASGGGTFGLSKEDTTKSSSREHLTVEERFQATRQCNFESRWESFEWTVSFSKECYLYTSALQINFYNGEVHTATGGFFQSHVRLHDTPIQCIIKHGDSQTIQSFNSTNTMAGDH